MTHFLDLFRFCPRCASDRFAERNVKSKQCETCGFTYYFNPAAAVAAFITDPESRLLVARRAKEPAQGTLDLPGGFLDSDETAEEAVKREILEETGLNVNSLQYLFSLPNRYVYAGFEYRTLDLFFQCRVDDLSGVRAADDVAELFFLPAADIDPERFGLDSIRRGVEIFNLLRLL